MGRSIAGTRILAAPRHIEAVIEEFIVHGVRTDRVIVGGDIRPNKALLKQVGTVCERHGIELTFVSQLLGLPELQEAAPRKRPSLINSFGLGFALGSYLRSTFCGPVHRVNSTYHFASGPADYSRGVPA